MNKVRLVVLGIVFSFIGTALAQTNGGYTCLSTSVTSASVPAGIMSPGRMTAFFIHVRSSPAADPVLIFPYTGTTVPTAVPSPANVLERPSGSEFSDAVSCDSTTCKDAVGQGWAAYLASGSSAITVDACYR